MNIKNFFIAVLCCMFSAALFAAPEKKPEYKFDFEAPREEVIVTKEICEQVGLTAQGIKIGIGNGLSNTEIKKRLYTSAAANLEDREGVVAVTMMITLVDELRDWPTQADYLRLAGERPDLSTLDLYRVLGQMRCDSAALGKPVSIVKIVRVK